MEVKMWIFYSIWCCQLMFPAIKVMGNEINLKDADGRESNGSILLCSNVSTVTFYCSYPDTRTVVNGVHVYALTQPLWRENGIDIVPNGDIFTIDPRNFTFEILQLNIKDYPSYFNSTRSYKCSLVYSNFTRMYSRPITITDRLAKPSNHAVQTVDPKHFVTLNLVAEWNIAEKVPSCGSIHYNMTLIKAYNGRNIIEGHYHSSESKIQFPVQFSSVYHLEVTAVSSDNKMKSSDMVVHGFSTPSFCDKNYAFCATVISAAVIAVLSILAVMFLCCVYCCYKQCKYGKCCVGTKKPRVDVSLYDYPTDSSHGEVFVCEDSSEVHACMHTLLCITILVLYWIMGFFLKQSDRSTSVSSGEAEGRFFLK